METQSDSSTVTELTVKDLQLYPIYTVYRVAEQILPKTKHSKISQDIVILGSDSDGYKVYHSVTTLYYTAKTCPWSATSSGYKLKDAKKLALKAFKDLSERQIGWRLTNNH